MVGAGRWHRRRIGRRNIALDGWSIRRRSSRAASGGRRRRWNTTGRFGRSWGNWATSLVWGRVHKIATDTTLNSYLLESTLNFQTGNYAFTRMELVDKDELFPQAACIRRTGSERIRLAECAI